MVRKVSMHQSHTFPVETFPSYVCGHLRSGCGGRHLLSPGCVHGRSLNGRGASRKERGAETIETIFLCRPFVQSLVTCQSRQDHCGLQRTRCVHKMAVQVIWEYTKALHLKEHVLLEEPHEPYRHAL